MSRAAETPMKNIQDILRDPSAVYADPADVLAADDLPPCARRRILEQWRYDLVRLQVASDENLLGDASGAGRISRIDECLRQLGAGAAAA